MKAGLFWKSYRMKRGWGWPRYNAFMASWLAYVWWPFVDGE